MTSPTLDLHAPVGRGDPHWIGEDGYYAPLDYWLATCGLYRLYEAALASLGDLRGKRVIDCGCGKGQTSVMLAKRGARVTAFDTSEADLATARRLAAANGVEIEFRRMGFEALDLPDAGFDLGFGACVLHHVDIPRAAAELARVLVPGARAAFVENSARNALLMLARRHLVGSLGVPRYGDDDEHPLRAADLARLAAAFPGRVATSHPDTLIFRLLDFYVLGRRSRFASRLLERADALAARTPLKPYGYFFLVTLERA